ncbi:MAG TPA: PaaI family thioesterase [Actinomycetota bacterium]
MDSEDLPLGGFNKLLGLRLEEASADLVVATVPVTPDLHQPYGLVHGGVYSSVVEATASVGAALWLGDRGRTVGIGNQTEFLRAVRDGVLRIVATPIKRGRSTQLWQVDVTDDHGHLAAQGRVRLMNLPGGSFE